MFFIDQPEKLWNINVIQGFLYKNFPLLAIPGILFIIFYLTLFFLRKKSVKIRNNFHVLSLCLMMFFWIPVYINYFIINIFDVQENLENELSSDQKKVLRLCDADVSMNGTLCLTSSFGVFVKNNLPVGSKVKLLSYPGFQPYLYYNIYPSVSFVFDFAQADYVLLYFPSEYFFQDGILYQIGADENDVESLGEFELFSQMGSSRMILRKVN
ncbi:MAG: hypothetical protein ABH881_04030 [bacterium]